MQNYQQGASYITWVQLMILLRTNVTYKCLPNCLTESNVITLSCSQKSMNVSNYPKGARYITWVQLMILLRTNVMYKCLPNCLTESNVITLSCSRKSIVVNKNQQGASYSKMLSYSKSIVVSPPVLVK